MNNPFKRLLLKIAGLSLKDQHWLLRQLNPEQQKLFVQHHGVVLLDEARRFAKIRAPELPLAPEPVAALSGPDLSSYPPLFVAIILEQGPAAWEEQYQQALPNTQHLKPATKAALFQQWQMHLTFAEQLEMSHGASN